MKRTLLALVVIGFLVGSVSTGVAEHRDPEPAFASADDAEPFPSEHPNETDTGDTDGNDSEDAGELENESSGEITYFAMSGRGYISNQQEIVHDHPGPPYVWDSEPLDLRVNVRSSASSGEKSLCARILDSNRHVVESLDCFEWSTTGFRLIQLELDNWPADTNGTHYIELEYVEEVTINDSTTSVVQDTYTAEVYVITKQGDLSDNGLTNAREVSLGTDFTKKDTSGNGLTDWEEVYRYGTDPLEADTTGDGFDDGTIARLGLPPSIPYIIHGVVFATTVGLFGIAVAGLRLRQWLHNVSNGSQAEMSAANPSPAAQSSVAPSPTTPQSKEDEVFSILREHGGQMRQADLVDETEWSKATVSRLLSTLEENDRIEKIRVGRGNVVRILNGSTTDGDARSETID